MLLRCVLLFHVIAAWLAISHHLLLEQPIATLLPSHACAL
jgi:hypothetical protein